MADEATPRRYAAVIAALDALTAQDPAKFQNKPLVEALFAELRDVSHRLRAAEKTHDLLALNRLLVEAVDAMVRFALLQRDLDA